MFDESHWSPYTWSAVGSVKHGVSVAICVLRTQTTRGVSVLVKVYKWGLSKGLAVAERH